jgi:glycosyltransferase involved in cell wall biosynthesis
MIRPLISIVIPCYNHGKYIDEAIKSIEESKDDNYELIIINDGSTDGYTNSRLEELKECGYNVIFQENQGLGRTRNNGIQLAKGQFILPLDADNKVNPYFISRAIDILEAHSEISIIYSDRQLFGDRTELVKVGEFNLSQILKGNYIDACSIYRKNVWETVGGYDEKMPIQGWEDWDFWLSAAEKNFKFHYISEPLFYYRVVENSMIHQLNNHARLNILIDYIYNKHISLLLNDYKLLDSELKDLRSELNRLSLEREHPSIKSLIRSLYKLIFR